MLFELFGILIIFALISFVGVFTLSLNQKRLEFWLGGMVAFAVGALLGDVFIHLLPELGTAGLSIEISLTVLVGMVVFFILEKYVHWHHCHHTNHSHEYQSFSYMILIGNALHNFTDGVILAGAFLASPIIGFSTAIAIFMHEIPQEIGDFGVLLKGGFSKSKALFYNFIVSLTAFIGAILTLLFTNTVNGATPFFVAFAVGGFLYIAGTDLLPQLQKDSSTKQVFMQLFFILFGIGIMAALLFVK
ncbi:MAG: ZIP family metal transporter [archaeon]|jgi:zinc and cadmium transporter